MTGAAELECQDEHIGVVGRKEYIRLKRRAIDFEAKNLKYVLVLPCEGDSDWCEMGDSSALIYKYKVCLELGSPVSMADDMDSLYVQYEFGRVRTRGFGKVRRLLKQAGLYKNEVKKDRCVIFELSKALSREEMRKIKETEKEAQAASNTIIRTHYADPALYQKMLVTGTRLHRICFRRLDKLSSSTNGKRIVELIDGLMRKYFEVSTFKMSNEEILEKWREMDRDIQTLIMELQIAAGMKLWSREICINVGNEALEIKKGIERVLKNVESKKANKK